jgi:hypothetical protein
MVCYVTLSLWAPFLLWTSVWWAEFLFCGWTELTFVETSIVYHQQYCLECIFSWISLFWENKNRLMMSFYASLNPPHQSIFNASTSLYETWLIYIYIYIYQRRTSLVPPNRLCVFMCIPRIFARQRLCSVSLCSLLGNGSVNRFRRQWIHATTDELLDVCVCGSVYVFP